MSNQNIKIGIIGGSGLDDPQILGDKVKKNKIHTPYGSPSDLVITGKLGDREVVVIPRHGDRHRIGPAQVNYRANIWAMKELGVTHIIAATACGSLREEIGRGDLVFIDQFIDRTKERKQTFYEGQFVCHIPMAEPFCGKLRNLLGETADQLQIKNHKKGTMVTIEGPRFSTKAESHMFRGWKGDVINMTTVPEVVLAREAGICYASIAMSTDYDCWREGEEAVTIDMVLEVMKENAENVKKLLVEVIPKVEFVECECKEAIKGALL